MSYPAASVGADPVGVGAPDGAAAPPVGADVMGE